MKLDNRKQVAHKIMDQVKNGEIINKEKAVKEAGYADSTARHEASKIVNSSQCQKELTTLLEGMENIRDMDIKELQTPEVREKMTPTDRINSLDKLSKNIQLISGRSTSNESISVTWDN